LWSAALKTHFGSGISGERGRSKNRIMIPIPAHAISILIVEDTQETRDVIETLLRRDGYWVSPARNEDDAVARIHANPPDLILISLGGTTEHILSTARRIRDRGGLTASTPIVIFSITNFPEGVEEQIGGNIFIAAPDNFDQLRTLLIRVLRKS
jgi:CheY-like chemotaxis protein